MHPCVGECGGRGTLSTVPQDPSIFFLVVEAKSFPWSLLIQAVSSRPPPVSSSLMLELQADTTQLFFFFFFFVRSGDQTRVANALLTELSLYFLMAI